jgi:hypothetical protein
MSGAGKGSMRRPTDEERVRRNWPMKDPSKLAKERRARLARRQRAAESGQDRMVRSDDLTDRGGA